MISLVEMRSKLLEKALFKEFQVEELDALLALLEPEEFAEGSVIVSQGEVGDCMYLVVEGSARVVHHRGEHSIELAKLRCGDFFGEIALVGKGPRSADVLAMGVCVLLKISQASVAALVGVYPAAGYKLLIAIGRILVERLRSSNQRYVDSLLFPVSTGETAS
jgi:CRP-like cAMP-binding protein